MAAPVPNANKAAYIAMAKALKPVFTAQGATQVVDCWGVDVPMGENSSFPLAVQLKQDETVVFSWITWPDKATADAGMANAMQSPEMQQQGEPPFDFARVIFGGFEVVSD
jgi:uncharacterized protein YbaA (DUF1428 family)